MGGGAREMVLERVGGFIAETMEEESANVQALHVHWPTSHGKEKFE